MIFIEEINYKFGWKLVVSSSKHLYDSYFFLFFFFYIIDIITVINKIISNHNSSTVVFITNSEINMIILLLKLNFIFLIKIHQRIVSFNSIIHRELNSRIHRIISCTTFIFDRLINHLYESYSIIFWLNSNSRIFVLRTRYEQITIEPIYHCLTWLTY